MRNFRNSEYEFSLSNEDEDAILDQFENDSDLDNIDFPIKSMLKTTSQKIDIPRVRFGWPNLQTQVLKDCIDISDAVNGIAIHVFNFSIFVNQSVNRRA